MVTNEICMFAYQWVGVEILQTALLRVYITHKVKQIKHLATSSVKNNYYAFESAQCVLAGKLSCLIKAPTLSEIWRFQHPTEGPGNSRRTLLVQVQKVNVQLYKQLYIKV